MPIVTASVNVTIKATEGTTTSESFSASAEINKCDQKSRNTEFLAGDVVVIRVSQPKNITLSYLSVPSASISPSGTKIVNKSTLLEFSDPQEPEKSLSGNVSGTPSAKVLGGIITRVDYLGNNKFRAVAPAGEPFIGVAAVNYAVKYNLYTCQIPTNLSEETIKNGMKIFFWAIINSENGQEEECE